MTIKNVKDASVKHVGPFIDGIILFVLLGVGMILGNLITKGCNDFEVARIQHKLDEVQLSLDETRAELAANHVVILCWDALASYYTEQESGGITASGKEYDHDQFTAAHRTLKFGTILLVENQENGKACPVRITDRGPAQWTGRSLDVSLAVAKRLGIIDQGVARLRCYYMVDGRPSIQD